MKIWIDFLLNHISYYNYEINYIYIYIIFEYYIYIDNNYKFDIIMLFYKLNENQVYPKIFNDVSGFMIFSWLLKIY